MKNDGASPQMTTVEEDDDELLEVQDQLRDIDQIMIAETKRRIESNQIMADFIDEYLKTLNQNITNKIDGDFQTLKSRVQQIDDSLTNLEKEIDSQIQEVNEIIDKRQAQTEKELQQGSNLLTNVKQAHNLTHQDLQQR